MNKQELYNQVVETQTHLLEQLKTERTTARVLPDELYQTLIQCQEQWLNDFKEKLEAELRSEQSGE